MTPMQYVILLVGLAQVLIAATLGLSDTVVGVTLLPTTKAVLVVASAGVAYLAAVFRSWGEA